jgi:hypothetical protein
MTLHAQLMEIQLKARAQGKSDDFIATAIIAWMQWRLGIKLFAAGWIDDDEKTCVALYEDEASIEALGNFLGVQLDEIKLASKIPAHIRPH